jgi:K+-sensing histidine kinase KdpD
LGSELERDKPGTGLGLYIARTLVQRQRGRIRVRDPEKGPGSVFEVQLRGKRAPEQHGTVGVEDGTSEIGKPETQEQLP